MHPLGMPDGVLNAHPKRWQRSDSARLRAGDSRRGHGGETATQRLLGGTAVKLSPKSKAIRFMREILETEKKRNRLLALGIPPMEVARILGDGIWVLLAFILSSCEINSYTAQSGPGRSVHELNLQVGGTRSATRSDGSGYANDHQTSWRDTTNMATAIAGGIATAQTTKAVQASKDGLSATQSANALKAQQSKDAAAAAKLAAQQATTGKAIDAGAPLTPVTVNPP